MSALDDDFVLLPDMKSGVSASDLQRIRKWLDPTEYDDGNSEYIKHLKSHLGGTGDWIETTPEYQSWRSSEDSDVLWIRAIAGAGKSVLAARSRARIARDEDAPVLHFFFRHIITTNRTPKQLVRDWLAQLLPLIPTLQKTLAADFLDQRRELDMVTFDTLWHLLRTSVARLPRVYCFADALDEMSLGHDDFFEQLNCLGEIPSCKVFITSRPVPHITAAFRKVSSPPMQILLGPVNMKDDISKYVDHRLDRDISRYIDHRLTASGLKLPEMAFDIPTALLVRETLKSKAHGSFLYARLMTDNLLDAVRKHGSSISKQEISEILESLPVGLGDMYTSMLADHAKRTETPWDLQLSILQWVTRSERPLRLLELAAAIDFQKGNLQRDKATKSIVRTACGPLLEILPSDVVGPIHHSFTEYLTSEDSGKPVINNQEAHHAMATQCLKYLISVLDQERVDLGPDAKTRDLQEAKLIYPFLDYALSNWNKHIHRSGTGEMGLVKLLDQLWLRQQGPGMIWLFAALGHSGPMRWLESPDTNLTSSQSADCEDRALNHYEDLDDEPQKTRSITPLHVAALAGLCQYVQHLVTLGYCVEGHPDCAETPLACAAKTGWTEVAKALLQAGASPDANDDIGLKPLHAAATRNHVGIVQVLLKAGVDPWTPKTREHLIRRCGNGPTSRGDTPLKYVCREGHLETTLAFIPYLTAEGVIRAVQTAFGAPNTKLALTLIESEAFDATLESAKNLIHTAASQGDLACMRALLRRGCDANVEAYPLQERRSSYGIDDRALPIHAFAAGPNASLLSEEDIKRGLELLCEAGNDINALTSQTKRAPLSLAITSYKMASALLQQGADVNTATDEGTTPLHYLAKRGPQTTFGQGVEENDALKVAKLWLEHGIDINARQKSDGMTALSLSMNGSWSNTEMGPFLLMHGANPGITDDRGHAALHAWAAANGRNNVQLSDLLQAGASVDARTVEGDTAIHILVRSDSSIRQDHEKRRIVLKSLVAAGAQLEAANSRGETALLTCSDCWIPDLLELGCRIDARDLHGSTRLHRFWTHGSTTITRLIGAGADPKWLDSAGNTVWHYCSAGAHRQPPAYDFLEIHAPDPGLANNFGQTPLLHAVAHDNIEFLEVLVQRCQQVDLDRTDLRGRSLAHIAATRNDQMMKRMIDLGVDTNARTNEGWTALHFAAQARKPSIVLLLLTYGTSPLIKMIDAKDRHGRTALEYAARGGVLETVDILIEHGAAARDSDLASALRFCTTHVEEEHVWQRRIDAYQSLNSTNMAPLATEALQSERDEDIARNLAVHELCKHGNHNVQRRKSGIRRCFRKLYAALDNTEEIFASARSASNSARPLYFSVRDRLLNIVLDLDNNMMTDELIAVYRTLPDDKKAAEFRGLDFWQKTRLIAVEGHGGILYKQLGNVTDSAKRDSIIGDALVSEVGHIELVQLLDPDMALWEDIYKCHSQLPQRLANAGAYEALQQLSARINVMQRPPYPVTKEMRNGNLRGSIGRFEAFAGTYNVWDVMLANACDEGIPSLPLVKVICEYYPISPLGKVAAMFALADGKSFWKVQALDYILSMGVDPNSRDSKGRTPVHETCASRAGWHGGTYCEATLECLLRHGADPNLLDNEGATYQGADLKLLQILISYGADVTLGRPSFLNRAVRARQLDVVKFLAKRGIDLNTRASDEEIRGYPDEKASRRRERLCIEEAYLDFSFPLHLACNMETVPAQEEQRRSIIELLLDCGADPNITTHTGNPIVHEAVGGQRSGGVELLLRHRYTDLEARDTAGNTVFLAFAKAISSRSSGVEHRGMLNELVGRGIDIEATNATGANVLHLLLGGMSVGRNVLVSAAYRDFMIKCQERGLTNAKDKDGRRPVHCLMLSDCCNWKHIEVLASYGADLTIPDTEGNSAFHHLAKSFRKVKWIDGIDARMAPEIMALEEAAAKTDDTTEIQRFEMQMVQAVTDKVEELQAAEVSELGRLVNVLHELDIDINGRNHAGETPIFNYIRHCPVASASAVHDEKRLRTAKNYVHRLEMLVAAGADIHAKLPNGQGILHVLASRSYANDDIRRTRADGAMLGAWKKLVADGLDPYMEDSEQRTALDMAAVAGNAAILELY